MTEMLNCSNCTQGPFFGVCKMNIKTGLDAELKELKEKRSKEPDPTAKSKITGEINAVVNGCSFYWR